MPPSPVAMTSPIVTDDFVIDIQTQGSSNMASSIYAVRLRIEGGLGLESGASIQVVEDGDLKTEDASRCSWCTAPLARHRPDQWARSPWGKAVGGEVAEGAGA